MLLDCGFTDVVTGHAIDTFAGAKGEGNARAFDVYGYAFMASRPADGVHRTIEPGSTLARAA